MAGLFADDLKEPKDADDKAQAFGAALDVDPDIGKFRKQGASNSSNSGKVKQPQQFGTWQN